jgi:glycosyltransferase involved in cell wall biosynthesis
MEKQDKKVILAITKSNFGGAQKYVYTLAKTLKNKGFLVKVLLGKSGSLSEKLEKEDIAVLKIKSLQRDFSLFKEIKVFLEILAILKKERPNILHLNSSKIGGLGSFAGRIAGIKNIIFTAHGFAFNENRNWISRMVLRELYWMIFLFSHKTICVSEETKRQAPKSFIPEAKFEVIYNAIEPIEFLGKQEAKEFLVKRNPNLQINKKWIGTLAELHHVKRIDLFIDSAREILKERKDLEFVVFGEGEERAKLELKLKTSKISDDFILFGYLEDASKYLKALDLFVLPSKSEAMPLSILEAMQADIPIVASNVGGIKEMVNEQYLFDKKSEMKDRIIKNLDIEPKYDLDKFTLESMTESTLLLYNQ